MNKPIKAKNLPLFSIIDLNQLRRENHLEGTEVTDFSRKGMEKSIFSWNSRPKHRVRTGSALLPPIPQWKSSWIGRNSGCWKRRCFLLAS